jgi:surfeit locus 1 family protein
VAKINVLGRPFFIRRIPTAMTILMLAVLIGLGTWQIDRLQWKEDLLSTISQRLLGPTLDIAVVDKAYADFQHAMATGSFLNDKELYMHAVSTRGEGGWHVLTPFHVNNGLWLLVDRGFVPFDKKDPDTRRDGQLSGSVTITGHLRLPQHRWPQPDNNPAANDWYWPDPAAMAKAMDVPPFLPFVLQVDATPVPGGYPVGGQTRVDLPNDHFTYALTWYGLACVLLVIYILFGFKDLRSTRRVDTRRTQP